MNLHNPGSLSGVTMADTAAKGQVTLLTGGIDRPYTFGLVMELIAKGVVLDVIGSDGVDFPEVPRQ